MIDRPYELFLYRLALEMRRPVEQLLDDLSWEELQTWIAFDALEPIGGRRLDLLAAHWMQTFVNMHRGEGQLPRPIGDFILVDMLRKATEEAATLDAWDEDEDASMDPTLLVHFAVTAKPWPGEAH